MKSQQSIKPNKVMNKEIKNSNNKQLIYTLDIKYIYNLKFYSLVHIKFQKHSKRRMRND